MAQPTNTFDTYDSIGEREDLSDVIYNISPTDTPFLSSAAKTKATAVLHEWQTDSLAAAVTTIKLLKVTKLLWMLLLQQLDYLTLVKLWTKQL